MPEQTPATVPSAPAPRTRPRAWVTWVLAAVVVVVFAASMVIARLNSPDTEFGGSDSAAVETLEADGVEPWFRPLFEPGSAEVESGLFALQAAIGAGIIGYALGALGARRRASGQTEPGQRNDELPER